MTLVTAPAQTGSAALIHRCSKHPNKVQFRNLDAAFESADKATVRQGQPIFVYVCDHCGYFHLSRKQGSENIGRRVTSRADGRLWTTESKPRETTARDDRFVAKGQRAVNTEKVVTAIRSLGNPDMVNASDVAPVAGVSRDVVTRVLRDDLRWRPTGATVSRRWHRPGATIEDAKPEPASQVPAKADQTPEWETLNPKTVHDLTVSQTIRVYGSMGYDVEVRIRRRR